MELNNIEITVTDADLAAIIARRASGDDSPVSDIHASINEDGVIAAGKFRAGFIKGSFEATVSLEADGRFVLARLARLKALGPVGNMFKGMILSAVRKKLGDVPGVDSDEDAIRIDPQVLLAAKGVAAQFETLAISSRQGGLTLKLSGRLDCPV